MLLDENRELLDGESFVQIRTGLVARILTNAPSKIAIALGFRQAPRGLSRRAVVAVSDATAVLVALAMLVFSATTLPAQSLTPTRLQEFNTAVRPTSSLETYQQPVITCSVGRAGFIAHAARQAATIEIVAPWEWHMSS